MANPLENPIEDTKDENPIEETKEQLLQRKQELNKKRKEILDGRTEEEPGTSWITQQAIDAVEAEELRIDEKLAQLQN